MKLLQINSTANWGSTGRIAEQIGNVAISLGWDSYIAYGRYANKSNSRLIKIGNKVDSAWHLMCSRLFDCQGLCSRKATKRFVEQIEHIKPDLIHLHNIHGYYINVEMLFEWIKSRPQMEVRWTLHDCWAFTGHCTHFSFVKCDKWKDGCRNCCQKREYPTGLFMDSSERNYTRKKQAFTEVANMRLITPSKWLANLVEQSFLNKYSISVEHNQIDSNVFKPKESDFRKKYKLENKKIVLGVATAWGKRKGLDDFIELSHLLDDSYQVILVGMTKKQLKHLPKKILGIQRTNCIEELVEIYSAADLFVNPSKEETFGLTTIEALACGTPAIVYKNTACEEVVNAYGGIAVEQTVTDIIKAIYDEVKKD